MLAKKFRLNRRQINLIYKKGKGQKFGILGLKSLAVNLSFSRFAIVVPLAVLKKATDRNRLRRVAFSEIGQILKDKAIQNKDYIIRFYQAPNDEKELRQIIQKVLQDV